MKNNFKISKIDQNIEIVKTLEKRAPITVKEVQSIQKEQKKYREFLRKQTKGQYNYIEVQSFSTV